MEKHIREFFVNFSIISWSNGCTKRTLINDTVCPISFKRSLTSNAVSESREKAKDMIVSGNVYVEGKKEEKAGKTFEESAFMEVRGDILPYVSRAGLKLEKAIKVFDIQ